MLPWSNWIVPSALGTKVKPRNTSPPVRQPTSAAHRHLGGTKAKPLAAYRRRLCCLRKRTSRKNIGPPITAAPSFRSAPPTLGRCSDREAVIVMERCDGRHRYVALCHEGAGGFSPSTLRGSA